MTDDGASAALHTLAEASGDPVAWMLAHAPIDDEPEAHDERAAVAEAKREVAAGARTIPLEEIKREFRVA